MFQKLMPARAAAQPKETEDLCDLDILQSREVRFKLFGRWRSLKPITNRAFIEFWTVSEEYKKGEQDAQNYLKIIHTLCEDITLEEVKRMTVFQQALLITHLTGKIVGRDLTQEIEKKNSRPIKAPLGLVSSN